MMLSPAAHTTDLAGLRAYAESREEDLESAISCELMYSAVRLPCGHAFDESDLMWLRRASSKSCPCCASPLPPAEDSLQPCHLTRQAAARHARLLPEGARRADLAALAAYRRACEEAGAPDTLCYRLPSAPPLPGAPGELTATMRDVARPSADAPLTAPQPRVAPARPPGRARSAMAPPRRAGLSAGAPAWMPGPLPLRPIVASRLDGGGDRVAAGDGRPERPQADTLCQPPAAATPARAAPRPPPVRPATQPPRPRPLPSGPTAAARRGQEARAALLSRPSLTASLAPQLLSLRFERSYHHVARHLEALQASLDAAPEGVVVEMVAQATFLTREIVQECAFRAAHRRVWVLATRRDETPLAAEMAYIHRLLAFARQLLRTLPLPRLSDRGDKDILYRQLDYLLHQSLGPRGPQR